jgi:hypothetical protein
MAAMVFGAIASSPFAARSNRLRSIARRSNAGFAPRAHAAGAASSAAISRVRRAIMRKA